MHKSELDIPVALIFFVRPDTLSKVFEKIKKARPAKLFLIQDGARLINDSDNQRINECRSIVDDIDWECEVFKNYSESNLGCGRRPFTGITWVFEHVDKAIILEDDCIPADSFFSFCKEMLIKYQNDKRVGIISGLNYFEQYDFGGNSYGFVKTGSIWGWATWKDRWEEYDFNMDHLKDDYIQNLVKMDITPKSAAKQRINTWKAAQKKILNEPNVSYWDYQWGLTRHINSWLSIVPNRNQITNVGIGSGSTHSGSNINFLPKKIAAFFFMDTTNLEFPLTEPKFVIPDRNYDEQYYKMIYPNILYKIINRITRIIKIQTHKSKKKKKLNNYTN
ncbi:glycosyltransferase family 2 protein [Alkalibacterium sp. f15]|uniref:glycosyltransferase family 2 protein n=1 Tax=Alkalibacterium sp. f15 TaxID=3414029 RepID=UPI003BF8EA47